MESDSTSFKHINKIAIPAIIAGISEPIISLADSVIIGKLGTTPLAAVGIASSLFLLIIWTLSQTKSAISAIVSQALGKNELNHASKFIPQAILFNVLFGFMLYVITVNFAEIIFTYYNATGELLDQTVKYYKIRAIGFPFTLATYAIFGVLRGIQNTKWAMQISLLGGLFNIVLDLILVFGIENIIPSFGIEGAAIASLIAQMIMMILAFLRLLKNSNLKTRVSFMPDPLLGKFIVMSLNLFIRTIALNFVYFLGVQYATGINESNAAAHTIAINIWLFSSFLIDGYANAGNAIGGKLIGAGDLSGLAILTKKLLKTNFWIASVLAGVYLILYPWMGSFFSPEKQVVSVFNEIFWLVVLCQPINAIAFTYDGVYKGLGKTALLRNTLLLSTIFGFVPFLFGIDLYYHHLLAVWISFLLWMILRGVILHIHFIRNYHLK